MEKKIQYPTNEWLEKYVEKHDCGLEDAECAWWDAQIDKGNPTPYDLDEEGEKNVKEITKGMARKVQNTVDAFGKKRTRERKPNENKRWIIDNLRVLFEGFALNGSVENVQVSNVERSVDFTKDGRHYTITLTEHRPPKEGK